VNERQDDGASPKEFRSGRLLDETVLHRYLGSCGRGVRVYEGCRLVPTDRIHLGDYSQIDEGVRVFAGQGVTMGRHVHLAFGAAILGGGTCEIGDFVGVSPGCKIITGSEDIHCGLTNPTVPEGLRFVRRGRVTIGSHALIFAGAILLPGVKVGEGAVVGAGAVVHRDLDPWSIYAGMPLVCVGTRDRAAIEAAAQSLVEAEATAMNGSQDCHKATHKPSGLAQGQASCFL
jgi:acetyltransferase-like isoleucine patch superfamily enzyme